VCNIRFLIQPYLLCSWFVYRKFSSFQRQLNIYNFVRITHGVDADCYYHECFRRGQEHLLHHIKRVPIKKNVPKSSVSQASLRFDTTKLRIHTTSGSSFGITTTDGSLHAESIQHEDNRVSRLELELNGTATAEGPQRDNQQRLNQATHDFEAEISSRRSELLRQSQLSSIINELLHARGQTTTLHHTRNELPATLLLMIEQMRNPVQLDDHSSLLEQLRSAQLNPMGSTQSLQPMTQYEYNRLAPLHSVPRTNYLPLLEQNEQHTHTSRVTLDILPLLRESNHAIVRDLSSVSAMNQRNDFLLQQILGTRHNELQEYLSQNFNSHL
jgi:HSF-type DNA-binding